MLACVMGTYSFPQANMSYGAVPLLVDDSVDKMEKVKLRVR